MIEIGVIPPCEHFCRCRSLEHLMTPNDTRSEATVPGSAPAVDAVTPLSLQ
jgi:hypothetical protein